MAAEPLCPIRTYVFIWQNIDANWSMSIGTFYEPFKLLLLDGFENDGLRCRGCNEDH